jgi:hypothetical protein
MRAGSQRIAAKTTHQRDGTRQKLSTAMDNRKL